MKGLLSTWLTIVFFKSEIYLLLCTVIFVKTQTNRTDELHKETWAGSLGGNTYTGWSPKCKICSWKEMVTAFISLQHCRRKQSVSKRTISKLKTSEGPVISEITAPGVSSQVTGNHSMQQINALFIQARRNRIWYNTFKNLTEGRQLFMFCISGPVSLNMISAIEPQLSECRRFSFSKPHHFHLTSRIQVLVTKESYVCLYSHNICPSMPGCICLHFSSNIFVWTLRLSPSWGLRKWWWCGHSYRNRGIDLRAVSLT